ncbi:MAG: hypothetical protein LAN84_03020 [Acidobacteriia bacterium]|nr:hypothetical protein [Terriglobia bacterium]
MQERTPSLPGRFSSVQEDWCAWLPQPQASTFETLSQQLETSYTMLSVSLNEAMALRLRGQIARSLQAVAVSGELSRLLTQPLETLLRAIEAQGRHHGTVPNVAPLNPANFRSLRCLRAARMNTLFSMVLLSQRAQFLHKLHSLQEMVADLDQEFAATVQELVEEFSGERDRTWLALDLFHYDLNTCLRETIVLCKSFLHVLPADALADFESAAYSKAGPPSSRKARWRNIRRRRPAGIAGK